MAINPNSFNTTGLPDFNSAVVEETREVTSPWARFFIALWLKTGGSVINISGTVLFQVVGSLLEAFSISSDGKTATYLATLLTPTSPGDPTQVQALTTSPFIFTAAVGGTLVVFSGQIELSRNAGVTWFTIGFTGGAIPLLAGDRVRVTWVESGVANRPSVTFFPLRNGP